MGDIANIPSLSQAFDKASYNFGRDVETYVKATDAETRKYVDEKYGLLAQEDARVNGVISNLLKIADAQPGTPEWDEGQNLYDLISNNYVGLLSRIEKTEQDIVGLKAFAEQTTQDISTWMGQVNGRIDSEIQRAQGEEAKIRQEIATLKSSLEDKDNLTDEQIATIQGQISTLQNSATLRKQEITALQEKQTEYGDRLDMLESKFTGFSAESAVSEFRRGLNGQPSAYGHERVPTA